jgi:site-specific recombinase XerC
MCYKDEVQRESIEKLEEKLVNVPEFIQNYFTFLNSAKSKVVYWSNIRSFLEWLIEQKVIKNTVEYIVVDDLKNVNDIHIVKYLDGRLAGMYGEKISLNTANNKMNYIRGFWSYLLENDYVPKNIATKRVANKYKVKIDKEVEVPTDEEVEQFLSNLESIKSEIIAVRNIAIVKLFMGSGIRIEELVGLDINDLHLDGNEPYISIMRKGEQHTKKDLDISQSAVEAINDYLKIRNLNSELKDMEPLFLSERKDRLAQNSIQKFFETYSNGMIHPHMLRHYAGTKMYESNHDIVGVSEQLGHGDINTTKKYYVKSDKSSIRAALNSI